MKFLTQWFARTGTMLGLLAIAAGLAVLAVLFLSAALYLALVGPLGMPLAALATGGALLVVALDAGLAQVIGIGKAARPHDTLERQRFAAR